MGIHRVSNARQSCCPCTTVQLLGRCVGSGIVGVGNGVEQSFGPGHLDQRVPGLTELSMPVLVVLGKCPRQVEENLLARSQASVSAGTVREGRENGKKVCHAICLPETATQRVGMQHSGQRGSHRGLGCMHRLQN